MIDPLTGKQIGDEAEAKVAEVKATVEKSLDDRVSELEAKFAKAQKVLVALTGHSDPLSLG